MPTDKIAWEFVLIVIAIIVAIIIIFFYVKFGKGISQSSCQMINSMIDKFSMGSGWYRIGLPHVC